MQTSLNLNVDIQKVSDVSTKNNNLKQNDKSVDTDNKFNDYLQKEKKVNESSKKDTVNNDTAKNDTKNISKNDNESNTDNQVENSKEIDEKTEKLSKDDILLCLQALVNALNQANQATEGNITINDKVNLIDKLNSTISDSLINALNLKDGQNQNILGSITNVTANINNNSNANLDPASLINNLLQILNATNTSELLDKKSLNIAQSLLSQLGLKLDDNSNLAGNTAVDDKSFIQDLISQVKDKVNALVDSNSNKEILNSKNINELIISKDNLKDTNEEGANKVSDKANTVVTQISTNEKSNSSSDESKKDSNSSFSKDDKILKSILGDDGKDTSKLSLFTMNTAPKGNAEAIKEAQIINKNNMAADVVKSVKFMTSSDMKEMIVKVNPGNLGEITIKLIEEDGNMKLSIKASAKETYSLLAQQTAEIKNHLSNQNIKIQEVNIGVYEDDTTFFKDGQFENNFSQEENRKQNSNTNSSKDSYVEDEYTELEAEDISNINMLA